MHIEHSLTEIITPIEQTLKTRYPLCTNCQKESRRISQKSKTKDFIIHNIFFCPYCKNLFDPNNKNRRLQVLD